MATPVIRSAQSGKPTLTTSRNDLAVSSAVTLTDANTANADGVKTWSILDKVPAETAILSSATGSSVTLTWTVPGPITIALEVLIDGRTFRSVTILSVPMPNTGLRKIAHGEEDEYDGDGNTRGYTQAEDEIIDVVDDHEGRLDDLDALITGGVVLDDDEAGGDMSGTFDDLQVEAIQGNDVGTMTNGQVFWLNGTTVETKTRAKIDTSAVYTDTAHSGDVSGAYNVLSVDKIKAKTIGTLTDGQLLKVNGSTIDTVARGGSDNTALHTTEPTAVGQVPYSSAAGAASWRDLSAFSLGGSVGMYTIGATGFDGLTASFSSVPSILPITKVLTPCRGVELSLGGGIIFEAGTYVVQTPFSMRHGLNASVSLTCTLMRNANWPNRVQDAAALQDTTYTTSTTTSCKHPSMGIPAVLVVTAQQTLFLMASAGSAVAWTIDTYGTALIVIRTG